jgi:hypothetical protein
MGNISMKIVSFVLLMLGAAGCGTLDFGSEFNETDDLMSQVKIACVKSANDATLAQKECFPPLTQKKILVRIEKITGAPFFTIEGHAGRDRSVVWCRPDKTDEQKIMSNPGTVKPGQNYWVSGDFTNFASGAYLDFYTLTNCKLAAGTPSGT